MAVPGPQRPAAALPSGAAAPTGVESFVGGPWPLPWSPTACSSARAVIRDVLRQWGLDDLVPTAELLVSELVSNALRHASGPVHLTLERVSGLRCLVGDGTPDLPRPADAGPEDESGRGLVLVDTLAARWGCERGPEGKSVWFELSDDPCAPGLGDDAKEGRHDGLRHGR
ncbi:ATP-binding protein [Streptomyces sp. NPDC126497]|uniref:ATP-binding protein n=1 Tax=Streptomyces sp. NPDC126497 TaxID=3155313 RepID=UPI003329A043